MGKCCIENNHHGRQHIFARFHFRILFVNIDFIPISMARSWILPVIPITAAIFPSAKKPAILASPSASNFIHSLVCNGQFLLRFSTSVQGNYIAVISPVASFSNTSSTVMRAPFIAGLPRIIFGLQRSILCLSFVQLERIVSPKY